MLKPLNYHMQALIELAYQSNSKEAEYHLSKLQGQVRLVEFNGTLGEFLSEDGLKNLAMHQRLDHG